jgi:murein DD-endopeptidase MepM/ murein hydrolase activator NlpD
MASGVLTSTVRRSDVEQTAQAYAGQTVPAASDGTAAGGADAQVVSAPALSYQLYTVAEGDTASAIAARFGINLQYLLAANSDLRDGEFIAVGQKLIIPPGNGVLHDVRYGETLGDIADRYGVTVEDVLSWPGNNLVSADQVVEDQLVFVPDGVVPAAVAPEPTEDPTSALVVAPAPGPAPAPAEAPVPSSGLIWPVTGPISSYMDGSHPLGIDIDLYATPFTTIAAATSGTVTFAGGDPCCSYGYYVIIMSPDGIETLYAHFSSISVSAGQTVNQGDALGTSGCTGYCTGNHLHFEVIDNGTRVNPLSYLP